MYGSGSQKRYKSGNCRHTDIIYATKVEGIKDREEKKRKSPDQALKKLNIQKLDSDGEAALRI